MSDVTVNLRCKLCLQVQSYTYTPFSLSNPIMCCCKCGHGKGTGGGFDDDPVSNVRCTLCGTVQVAPAKDKCAGCGVNQGFQGIKLPWPRPVPKTKKPKKLARKQRVKPRLVYAYVKDSAHIRKAVKLPYACIEIAGEHYLVHISKAVMKKLVASGAEVVTYKEHRRLQAQRTSR